MTTDTQHASFDTFGAFLRYLRRRRRLTQRALALAVGYSEAQICRLERNRRLPEPSTLLALFVPALGLRDEPELTRRLLKLAAMARRGDGADGLVLERGAETLLDDRPGNAGSQRTPGSGVPHAGFPIFLTSFIGRRRELDELRHLVRDQTAARLLVLTGPAGTGKTRLAVQVARELAGEFAAGAAFVPLAAVRDPDLVAPAILAALHRRESSGRSAVESLVGMLNDQHMLLVLDNFEQVVAGASLLPTLLAAGRQLRIVVTSRAMLHISGAQHYQVAPLPVPGRAQQPASKRLVEYDSVRLFVERATAALPTFTLTDENAGAVATLCRGLDGIPLAIELTATRVSALSVEQVASRLDSVLPLLTAGGAEREQRQRTLRAALAWSYELLEKKEQRLFARLSVFTNGWTTEAAETVCAVAPLARTDILPLLVQLLDQSMVTAERRGEAVRYRLLEVLRQYGAEHIPAGEAAALRSRHAEWFGRLAKLAEAGAWSGRRMVWADRLESEHDNLWAVLRWLEETGRIEQGLTLAASLGWFWELRGQVREGRDYLTRLLHSGHGMSEPVRAKALHAAASLARYAGDLATATAYGEEAILLWRALDDRRGLAMALYTSGHVAHQRSDFERAASYYDESLVCWRSVSDRAGPARVLQRLGVLAQEQGHHAEARHAFQEALALCQEAGDSLAMATCYNSLGGLTQEERQYDRAAFLYGEDLRLRREAGDRLGAACALDGLGTIAREQGDYVRAVALGEEAVLIKRELDEREQLAYSLYTLCLAVYLSGDRERADSLAREQVGIDRALGNAVDVARRLEGLAGVVGIRAPTAAAHLLGAAVTLRQTAEAPPRNPAHYEDLVVAIRSQLSPEAFAAAWSAGASMTPEEAIACAIGPPVARP